MPKHTRGSELMQKINDGRALRVPTGVIEKARTEISGEIEELLEVGARIRPLLLQGKRIGWVRGVHPTERKYLRRYFHDALELAEHVVRIGTTLSDDYIDQFSAIELRNILRVITEMTNSDLRLYPYIGPFVTTSTSEQLWFSQGTLLTAFHKRVVELPEGSSMTLLAPPDQARLWASLCSYRERAKSRLDATSNAVLIIRAWAGKNADPIANEMKHTARSFITDIIDPWVETVQIKRAINIDDGWAHGEDNSREGLMREITGMMKHDRHEQVITAFESQQKQKAEAQQQKIEKTLKQRGGPGFIDQKTEILTADQANKRASEAARSRSKRRAREEELGSNNIAKLSRYQ